MSFRPLFRIYRLQTFDPCYVSISLFRAMRLEERVKTLETRMFADPVVLHFADRSTRELRGPRGFLLDLFPGLSGENLSPEQAEQFDLIRRCSSVEEPGGGHLAAMLRALMDQPTEEPGNS